MKICSFVASATELVYALGLGRSLVGRSDCCDYPAGARRKPIVVRSRISSDRLSSRGIHEAVQRLRRSGEHQYAIDVALLKRLQPDVVVMQELCEVCAATHPEIDQAVRQLPTTPRVIPVTAGSVQAIGESIMGLGHALGRSRQAQTLRKQMRRSIAGIRRHLRGVRSRPRVWCVEWLDPLMAAGHWVPEMVTMAGGIDGLLQPGQKSICVSWEDIRRYDPEVILVMPCSFAMERTICECPLLKKLPGWASVSAVRSGRVFAVHGGWFHHPGPRLIRGLELMAALFHPELGMRPSPRYAKALR